MCQFSWIPSSFCNHSYYFQAKVSFQTPKSWTFIMDRISQPPLYPTRGWGKVSLPKVDQPQATTQFQPNPWWTWWSRHPPFVSPAFSKFTPSAVGPSQHLKFRLFRHVPHGTGKKYTLLKFDIEEIQNIENGGLEPVFPFNYGYFWVFILNLSSSLNVEMGFSTFM